MKGSFTPEFDHEDKLDNFKYNAGSVRLQPKEEYRSRVDKCWKRVKNWSDHQAGMQEKPFPATPIKDFFPKGHGFDSGKDPEGICCYVSGC